MRWSKNRPAHIKRIFTRVSVNNLINWKSIYLNTEFCPSLHCLSLTDGVVGAYVQFDLNQTLSQFLHWHEISASQIHTLAVRNSSGEGATLWKNDEGQNLERHSRKSQKNFPCCFIFFCVYVFSFPSSTCCFCARAGEISDTILTLNFFFFLETTFLSHTMKRTIFPIASVTSIIIKWCLIASRHLNSSRGTATNSAGALIAAATAPY